MTEPSPIIMSRTVFTSEGLGRVNRAEATVAVNAVVQHLRQQRSLETALSVGIVTFNTEQQKLIEDLLEIERRKSPELEAFFGGECTEPVMVKNLENVQGDERDIIIFSIGYGPDEGGRVTANFGPLNRDGGERRLNVAITRARRELRVFATLRAEQIDLARTGALGVRDLRHFLEFAERGPKALAEAVSSIGDDYESPFEQAVGEALRSRGWTIRMQVGISGFRIDIGVIHPDHPGRFLAGVECDGATYHRSATARDRDRLREMVLRGLGWEIVRVWSTNWWVDPRGSLENLHDQLLGALEKSRGGGVSAPADLPGEQRVETTTAAEEPQSAILVPIATAVSPARLHRPHSRSHSADDSSLQRVAAYARNSCETSAPSATYQIADLDKLAVPICPDQFFEPGYAPYLQNMIAYIISIEGPVMDDVLVRRLARAHGFKRSGQRIRERVLSLIPDNIVRTAEEDRVFFWPAGSDGASVSQFRRAPDEDARLVEEIALAELAALARELDVIEDQSERLSAMARAMGLARLREATRQRLALAVQMASD